MSFRIRIVDAALLVATIAGTGTAVYSARERYGLQGELARLTNRLGDLVVADPAQLHIRAIDTGAPLDFEWRVYAPAGREVVGLDFDSVGSNVCRTFDIDSRPREFLARIRFNEEHRGAASVYRHFGNGRCACTCGSVDVLQFLRNHQDELDIEQLGSEGVTFLKVGESATLLRVEVPQSLIDKARNSSSPSIAKGLSSTVYECRLELK